MGASSRAVKGVSARKRKRQRILTASRKDEPSGMPVFVDLGVSLPCVVSLCSDVVLRKDKYPRGETTKQTFAQLHASYKTVHKF